MKVAEALRGAGIDPREARLLLAAASGRSQASLAASPETDVPAEAEKKFRELAVRRAGGEPIAYLLGRREFYGLDLEVTPAVLVPRPETELLVDLALERRPATVLDLGTGSGAIALAVKKNLPAARVIAVDAEAGALEVARRNAAKHGLDVDFRQGRWFGPVEGERFELVLSNPPYVAEGDPHLPALRHEPRAALVSGADGLDALREITRRIAAFLRPGGWVLLEHGHDQAAEVRRLLAAAGLAKPASWPDLSGIARVSGATLES